MKLPDRKNASISKEKLLGYLLSETHAVGKFKAKFFRSLGFDDTNMDILEKQLLKITQSGKVQEKTTSPHGSKYVIDGMIKTPGGSKSAIKIRTVWIIELNNKQPRFITAYPV